MLKDPAVHGGGGFAAATVQDLGIEPTLGATSGEGKAERIRKKVIEVGEGLRFAGASAGGVSGGSRKKKGGALKSLKDMDAMRGQPEPTVQAKVAVKAEGADKAVGGGGLGCRRIAIVKEEMKKRGRSLIAASRYVKEPKLY